MLVLDGISNYNYEVLILGAIPDGVVDYIGNKLSNLLGILPIENRLKYNFSYYTVRYSKLRITRLNRGLSRAYLAGYIIVSNYPRLRLINLISKVNTNITVIGRKERYAIYLILCSSYWLIYYLINI